MAAHARAPVRCRIRLAPGRTRVVLALIFFRFRLADTVTGRRAFPLSEWTIWDTWKDDDGFHKERDEKATEAWNRRERELWRDLWRLPQAIAWHMPRYQYMFTTIALYVRQFVLCESSEAKAADRTALARYADTIGLTPQGLV